MLDQAALKARYDTREKAKRLADIQGVFDVGSPFQGDRPGEEALRRGAVDPWKDFLQKIISPRYQTLEGQQGITSAWGDISGIAPELQSMMGVDPAGQAKSMEQWAQMMAPGRQTAQQNLQGTMAGMGMGGGRLARALTQQGQGWDVQDVGRASELSDQANAVRTQIGQMLFGGAQQQSGQQAQSLQDMISAMLAGTSAISKAPMDAFALYNPPSGD